MLKLTNLKLTEEKGIYILKQIYFASNMFIF